MNNRKYLIIPASEVKKINFQNVLEHSNATLSYSGDGKRTFIKWEGNEPDFVANMKNVEGPYTHEQILEIIRSDDWTSIKQRKKVT